MFKARGLTTFIYERNYKTDHMQIQVIPIHKKYKEGFITCIIFRRSLWFLEKTGCHTINFDVLGNRGTSDIICATAERCIQVTLLSKSKYLH